MRQPRKKLVIIIPTYNESELIIDTVYALQTTISTLLDWECRILVFDSNSPDGTAQIIQQLQKQCGNLLLQSEMKKSGLGSAYIQAMLFAMETLHADFIMEYDADGSHQPQFIAPMLQLIQQGYDVVSASRYIKGGSIPADWGIYRRSLSIGGNWVARFLLNRKHTDFTSGFRITSAKVLKKIHLSRLLSKQYAYKIHLLWALYQQQVKIIEYPIDFIDRKKGYSKLPTGTVWDSLKVVLVLWSWRIKRYFFKS